MPVLEVAEDARWLEAFGVTPQTEEVSGDDYVREVRVPTDGDDELHVTWDDTNASVRVRHERSGAILVDLYRESASRQLVGNSGRLTAIVVEYGSAELVGRIRVQMTPTFAIEDNFLRG